MLFHKIFNAPVKLFVRPQTPANSGNRLKLWRVLQEPATCLHAGTRVLRSQSTGVEMNILWNCRNFNLSITCTCPANRHYMKNSLTSLLHFFSVHITEKESNLTKGIECHDFPDTFVALLLVNALSDPF